MIHFKNLTVRNFMSVVNATQGIDFDRRDLTLVLGENLYMGGDGSRNGTRKTTIDSEFYDLKLLLQVYQSL